MADDKRTNGQLWIDASTNSLRYKSKGKQFTLSANESLFVKTDDKTLYSEYKVGNLVAIDDTGSLKKAVFPDDIEKVIGVIGISPIKDGKTFVTKQGTVVIDKSVFYKTDDEKQLKVGLPVYWFISDTFSNPNDLKYSNSDGYAGRLTTLTPSGFKESDKSYSGEKGYNVGYDNLPQVGVITDISDTTVTVYVNIDKFDSSIEWNYPYLHGATDNLEDAGCTEYTPTDNVVTINIYHGLCNKRNVDNIKECIPKCRCSIVAIKKSTDSNNKVKTDEYPVLGYSSLESSDDKGVYTQIVLKTSESLRYRVSGVINYKYDKDHEVWK